VRRAVVALVIAACDSQASSSTLLVDGMVISVSEGESRTFRLERTGVSVNNPPAALGASVDGDQLVLNVRCDAVPGTSGPPRELELDLDSDVVTVEVHPSALPPCDPRVVACLHEVSSDVEPTGMNPCIDPATGRAGPRGFKAIDNTTADQCPIDEPRIDFDYVDPMTHFSDPTQRDQALLFHLVNPDPTDAPLNFVVTTDAPLKLPLGSHDACTSLPNANIVGTFTAEYTIVRGTTAADPLVAAGQWELGWNKHHNGMTVGFEPYGIEVYSCEDGSPTCTPHRLLGAPQWCIPSHAGQATSIHMNVWASPDMDGPSAYKIGVFAKWDGATTAPITLIGDGQRGNPIEVGASHASIPIDVLMDVETGTGPITVTLTGKGSAPLYDQSQAFHLQFANCP
jgi:hypothetical protein